jgi:membrane protein required for colicin V production
MNSLDAALFAVLAVFAGIGALRGALREIYSLATWLLATLAAWWFATSASTWFSALSDELLRHMLGFLLVFVVVFLTVTLATLVLRMVFPVPAVGMAARAGGAVLGAARAVLILTIIVLLAGLTSLPKKPLWHDSKFVVYFQTMAVAVRDMLPGQVARQFRYG